MTKLEVIIHQLVTPLYVIYYFSARLNRQRKIPWNPPFVLTHISYMLEYASSERQVHLIQQEWWFICRKNRVKYIFINQIVWYLSRLFWVLNSQEGNKSQFDRMITKTGMKRRGPCKNIYNNLFIFLPSLISMLFT